MNREPAIDVTPAPLDAAAEPWDPNVSTEWDQVPQSEATPADPPPVKLSRRRWRLVPRTLTNRLVLGVVSLVVVLVLGIGTATYVALHSFLLNRLDQQLAETARPEALASLVNHRFGQGVQGPQAVWIAVVDWSSRVRTADGSRYIAHQPRPS